MKSNADDSARPSRGGPVMMPTMLIGNMRSYLRTRNTVRGLLRLSDRDLDDLQLTRVELALIARRYFCR